MNIGVKRDLRSMLHDAGAFIAHREGGFVTLHLPKVKEAFEIFADLMEQGYLSEEHRKVNFQISHGMNMGSVATDAELPGDPIRPSRVKSVNNRGLILSDFGAAEIEQLEVPVHREKEDVTRAIRGAEESAAELPGFTSRGAWEL